MNTKEIGSAIKIARKNMQLTQQEFATAADIGVKVLSRIEAGQGNISLDKALNILRNCGLKITVSPK